MQACDSDGHPRISPEEKTFRGENAMRHSFESNTEDLLNELMSTSELEKYLDRRTMEVPSLASYLQDELRKRGLRRSKVLKDAQIEQTFGWYVFNGKRGMSRDNVLKICFAMGFDARHANRALQAAGASVLYPRSRRDAIIIYCLEHGQTLQQANDTLYALGEECL